MMKSVELKMFQARQRAVIFSRFAWGVLGYNLLVIMFGAYVRATGSGAGCGGHWPTCQGVILPAAPQAATLIEFTHRATSGITVLLSILLVIAAWQIFGKKHPVRLAAALTLTFTLTEALIGAGLVLLGLVANDQSFARAVSQALHLTNTLILLACIAMTAWWASAHAPIRLSDQGKKLWFPALALGGMIGLEITGAITALGDTLYPAQTLAAGLQQDANPAASFLIHLRVYHPVLAMLVALYAAGIIWWVRSGQKNSRSRQLLILGMASIGLQLALGGLNVLLLAPVWMQLIHLLVADLVWLTMVFSTALVLGDQNKIPGLRLVLPN